MATPLRNFEQAYQIASDYYLVLMSAINSQGDDASSYSIEGQVMSRRTVLDKLKSLREEMRQLKELMQIEGGGYERRSYGIPG